MHRHNNLCRAPTWFRLNSKNRDVANKRYDRDGWRRASVGVREGMLEGKEGGGGWFRRVFTGHDT